MAETPVDLDHWPRTAQFHFFRTYARPHFAVTSRVDMTHALTRKAQGLSMFRASLYAIGAGLHAVPELLMRFRGETVVQHDRIDLSPPVPRATGGGFNYAYVPWMPDFATFDAKAASRIDAAARQSALNANADSRDDVAYLSCLPWLDFTAVTNALPGPEDCIPRISWGRIVTRGGGSEMALAVEVHHALVDGEHLGAFFAAAQTALDQLPAP